MKKVLLLIINLLFLFLGQSAYSYQTVLVDFPDGQGWHAVYYQTITSEAILQYVPAGQTDKSWIRTVVFHSYNDTWTNNAAQFIDRATMQMESKNSTQLYKYSKYTDADSIATRCITKNSYMSTQCEIYRVSKSFEGLITMHYINKNVSDYKETYSAWFNIMQNIRIYYSYYMDDRVLDKATSFQL